MQTDYHLHAPGPTLIRKLSKSVGCSKLIASILVNRNIIEPEQARRFLSPSLNHLRPPFAIKDMQKAVERIAIAIQKKERILIFGDYDVDGVTATVLLYEFLKPLGIDVNYYIPHRIEEGYSLQKQHIEEIALPGKYGLIITADCGTSSHQAIEIASSKGIDVIVTDHHHVPEVVPPALAILNPKRLDCEAGFDYLAGVGVVFSLLIGLRKELRRQGYWESIPEPNLKALSDLVALGTVADQVPLIDDNRVLVKTGIEQMNKTPRPGIAALSEISAIENYLDSESISFRLAPRLNAAGRLAEADLAVKLLLSADPVDASKIAKSLNLLNVDRQNIEQDILQAINKKLAKNSSLLKEAAIVLADESWHEGVLGIVASRLVKEHHCPVALVAIRDGIGRGSARSLPGFDLFAGLRLCDDYLDAFGGHAMAAGFRLNVAKIPGFTAAFNQSVQAQERFLSIPNGISVDAKIDFDDITDQAIDSLEILKPFGNGNPEPILMAENLTVVSQKIVGERHRQVILSQRSESFHRHLQGIEFNIDPNIPLQDHLPHVIFNLRWNRWNGKKRPQMIIL